MGMERAPRAIFASFLIVGSLFPLSLAGGALLDPISVQILSPQSGAVLAPGSEVSVVWKSPVNDFTGAQLLFVLEVVSNPLQNSSLSHTTDYTCRTIRVGEFRCEASLRVPSQEGAYYFRVRPHVLEGSVVFAPVVCGTLSSLSLCDNRSFFIDTTPPVLTLDAPSPTGTNGWYTSPFTVTLSCTDSASGCSTVRYRLNGGPWIEYQGPISIGSEGTNTLDFTGTDRAGNSAPIQTQTFLLDTRPPSTTLEVSPADGSNGWHTTPATVTVRCVDATSGCFEVEATVGGRSFQGPSPLMFNLSSLGDGVFEILASSQDLAGNSDSGVRATVKQDLQNPSIVRFCPTNASGSCQGTSSLLRTEIVPVLLEANDGSGSGITLREIWATSSLGSTSRVRVPSSSQGAELDLRSILSNPVRGVYRGNVTFYGIAQDASGRSTSVSVGPYRVDTTADPKILLELIGNPETFLPNGSTLSLSFHATWVGGPLVTQDVRLAQVVLTDDRDPTFRKEGTTDLSGIVTFTLQGVDTFRTLRATVTATAPGDPSNFTVIEPPPLDAIWTGLSVVRLPTYDSPRQNGWANVGEIYGVGYFISYTYNGAPASGVRLTLTSGSTSFSALSGSDGKVRVPTRFTSPSEISFTSTAFIDPPSGPPQSPAGPSALVRWAQVVYRNLSENRSNLGWHEVGENVTFSFEARLDFGSGTIPVNNGTVTLTLGSRTVPVPVAGGSGSTTISFSSPTKVVPTLSSVVTSEGITAQVPSNFGPTRWTEIVLSAIADDDFVNVNDTVRLVTFSARWAHDEDGNGLLDDPLGSATFDVQTSDGTTLTSCALGSNCSFMRTRVDGGGVTFLPTTSDKNVLRPSGGVPLHLPIVWTLVTVSGCSTPDTFVNLQETITKRCQATYAHDGSPVTEATMGTSPLPSGCTASGSISTGNLTETVACTHPTNLTGAHALSLSISSESRGIRNLSSPLTFSGRWGKVIFEDLLPNSEGWHNVTDSVNFSFRATYVFGPLSEDREPASQASVVLLAQGTFNVTTGSDGSGKVALRFTTPTDVTPSLRLLSTPEGITLYENATFHRQRWTEIVLSAIPDDEFVNVNDTITYQLRATWAHDEDGNGALDDALPSAVIRVVKVPSPSTTLATCTVTAGNGTCSVTLSEVYSQGIRFVVTSTSTGVVRQRIPLERNPVWTRIVVSDCISPDVFVNVNDTIEMACTATYEHDGSEVPEAHLSFPSGNATLAFPGRTCTLEEGRILDGILSAVIRCNGVLDAGGVGAATPLSLVVKDGGDIGVTMLKNPLLFRGTWTELVVMISAPPSGTLTRPDSPLLVEGSVRFAHDISTGTPPPNGTFFAIFARDTTGEEFNCVANITGSCTFEISKHLGRFNFSFTAASLTDTDGDGLVEVDISRMGSTPPPRSYRWTAIGFDPFECFVGSSFTVRKNCTEAFQIRQIVKVVVRAVAADSGTPLAGATVSIAGQSMTTDSAGKASRTFVRFSPGTITVTARGISTTIDGTSVTWDIPRSETLRWS